MANSIFNQGRGFIGEKTVTTGGTAEALVSRATGVNTQFWRVTIRAKAGNTNQVYVGGSDVDSNTNDGLDANDSLTLEGVQFPIDLADVWLDVDTDGEGADFWATN